MENRNRNQNQEITRVTHVHSFNATSKQVRKLGYDLGYGVASGIFSAMFMMHMCLGIMKAVKRHMEKKLDVKVERGEPVENEENPEIRSEETTNE